MPASTIQSIIGEMQTNHEFDYALMFDRLPKKLLSINVSGSDKNNITEDLHCNDIFSRFIHGDSRPYSTRQT
jgi:hypothetical protein